MKKILLKAFMLLCLILWGGGNSAWAETRTENFSSSNATNDNYNCTSSLGTADNRKDFDYSWSPTGSGTVFNSGIKLGSGSATGSVTSSDILADIPTGTEITVKVYAAVWNTDGGKVTLEYNGSSETLDAANAAITSTSGAYSASAFESSTDFTITKAADVEDLKLASSSKRIIIDKVEVVFIENDTRTAVNMTSFSAAKTIILKNNTTTTSVTNDQSGWTPSYTYKSSDEGVATVNTSGVITAVAKGTATITAALNISDDDTNWKKGSSKSMNINITVVNPEHTAHFSVNGTINAGDDCVAREDDAITFPSNPSDIYGKKFQGWTKTADYSNATTAPSDICKAANMGDDDVTYYAVFATQEGSATPQTVTWNISGVNTPAAGGSNVNTTLKTSSVTPSTETGVWTAIASSSYAGTSNGMAQLGSGSYKFAGTISLSETSIPSSATIKKIDLTATSSATDANPYTIKATVNGNAFGTADKISSGNANCSWTDEVVGNNIVLTTSCGYNKNIIISAIAVSYTDVRIADYCTTVSSSTGITISAAGYSTLYLGYAVTIPDGVQAFTGVLDGDKLTMTELSSGVIPAETAVVLKAEATNYTFEATTCAPFSGSNDLKGCLIATTTSTIGGGTVCTLAKEDGVVGFYKFTGPTLGANKAYLVVTPETPARVTMSFEDEESAIETVEVENPSNDMFDLMGRRTNNKTGLRIVNGKKVMLME